MAKNGCGWCTSISLVHFYTEYSMSLVGIGGFLECLHTFFFFAEQDMFELTNSLIQNGLVVWCRPIFAKSSFFYDLKLFLRLTWNKRWTHCIGEWNRFRSMFFLWFKSIFFAICYCKLAKTGPNLLLRCTMWIWEYPINII